MNKMNRHEGKEVTFVFNDKNTNFSFQKDYASAFKEGIEKFGAKVYFTNDHLKVKTKNVAFWSWRPHVYHNGKNMIVFERGYIGDRFSFSSIATNGLNGFGEFHSIINDGGQRFDYYWEDLYKDWNNNGEQILIIGQTPGDESLRGVDLNPWYNKIAQKLSKIYPDKKIKFRPHPNCLKRVIKENVICTYQDNTKTLEEDFENSFLVVTYNSTTAVNSLLYGKPTYVEDKGSMCYSIANNDLQKLTLDEPKNRKNFFNALAYCQWSLEEIKEGFPLFNLKLE